MGEIKKKKNKLVYNGYWPEVQEGDQIAIMKLEDLEKILEEEMLALLLTAQPMKPELYENRPDDVPPFEDEIIYTAKDKTEHKLFLDRNFYSHNFKDMIFIRYVSVDQSIIEEENGINNGNNRPEL